MRTLETLRLSCANGQEGAVYNSTSTLTAGIANSGNQFIPDIILQPGRYIIETKIDLKFVSTGYYTNGTDTHKVVTNYRTYNADPLIVDTDYLVLNDGGSMYFQGATSHYNIIMHSNISTEFEVIQNTGDELSKGLFFLYILH